MRYWGGRMADTLLAKVANVGESLGRGVPLLGGGIALNEVMGKRELADSLDLSSAQRLALEGVYAVHLGQASFDGTMFGGEFATQILFDKATRDWPEELQEYRDDLRPSSLAGSLNDLFGTEKIVSPEQLQFESVVNGLDGSGINLSPEATDLAQLYNQIQIAEADYEQATREVSLGGEAAIMAEMEAEAALEEAYADFEDHYDSLGEERLVAVLAELEGADTMYAGNQEILDEFHAADGGSINSDLVAKSEINPNNNAPAYETNTI